MPRGSLNSYEVLQLWLKYTEFKSFQLSASTIKRDYGKTAKRLLLMPDLATEIEIRDWFMRRYSTETTRRTLQAFSACCAWAVRSRYIRSNPFEGLDKDFRRSSHNDRRSFTTAERDLILQVVQDDLYTDKFASIPHSFYIGYFKFLFWTGCRLEEANGLRWSNVLPDCSRIRFCEAMPADTRILGATKTNKQRDFPCNERLQRLMLTIPRVCEWVFFSPKTQGAIDSHNVLNRTWRPVLEELVDARKLREYLPLKHCRHTFITLAIEAGMDAKDIAPLVGNSPDIIYRHYASARPMASVPLF